MKDQRCGYKNKHKFALTCCGVESHIGGSETLATHAGIRVEDDRHEVTSGRQYWRGATAAESGR